MLEVVLHILSVLGVIFLVLLGILIVLLLAAAFFPVSYRIRANREDKEMSLAINVWWLFGLLRASYSFPEPGYAVLKLLFFRIFDTAPQREEKQDKEKGKRNRKDKKRKKNKEKSGNTRKDAQDPSALQADSPEGRVGTEGQGTEEQMEENVCPNDPGRGIYRKIQTLKDTISGICDKIREIWENISYYVELAQEEDTKLLFSHVLLRVGKVLKNLRPRHIKARVLYGFNTPDATGYVYGIYCILAPALGSGVSVTPDFENNVLRGEVLMEGHITLWVVVINGLKLLFDQKFKKFMNKMKKEKREVS